MPVSGNQETGVKPIAWRSSDYSAGIPIKKRRFPLIQPASPPSEDGSLLPAENELQKKGHSSPSQGSTISNASGVATRVSGLSDASKNIVPKEETRSSSLPAENESQQKGHSSPSQSSTISIASGVTTRVSGLSDASKNIVPKEEKSSDLGNVNLVLSCGNHPRFRIEEPSLTIQSVPLADIDSKQKLVEGKNSTNILINSAKAELRLAPNEAFAHNVGKETYSKLKMEGKCQAEIFTVSGNTELSLGFDKHLIPVVAGQNIEESSQNQGNEETISLNLSLSKGESSTQHKSDEFQSSSDGANIFTNRSNWDLNTTMDDAWEGDMNDTGAGQVAGDGLNTKSGPHDIKPLYRMDGMVDAGVISEKRNTEGIGCKFDSVASSTLSGQQYNAEDSLRLGLSPSCLQSNLREKPSSSSEEVYKGRVGPNISFPRPVVPSSNINMVNLRIVKSEPLDENVGQDFRGAKANTMRLLDTRVKRELVERCNQETMSSNFSILKLVDPRSIKPEPGNEVYQEAVKEIEGMSNQSDKQMLEANDSREKPTCSSSNQPDKQMQQAKDSGRIPTCSTETSISEDVSNRFEHSMCTNETQGSNRAPQEACESGRAVALETISASVGHDDNKWNVTGVIDSSITEDKNVDDPEQCRSKFMDELPPDSRGTVDGSVSDEEKINLSGDMLEEDSYGSDYESDGNHDSAKVMDTEQDGEDDLEDGEVRESVVETAVEDPTFDKIAVEHINDGDSDNKMTDCAGFTGDDLPSSSYVEEKVIKAEDPGEFNRDDIRKSVETARDEKSNEGAEKDMGLQELVETQTDGVDIRRHIKAVQGKEPDLSGRMDAPESLEGEKSSDQATNASKGTLATASLASDGNVNNPDMVEKNHSALPKAEAYSNGADSAKNANSGGSRSRIINLSGAASPAKSRSISGRLLPSQIGGRLLDVGLDGEKLHPRGRDEVYVNGSHKFSRERHHDMSSRNSRLNFVRGRGIVSSRIDTVRSEWDSERDFAADFYNGRREFPVPGRKFEPAATDADTEINNYNNIGQDGAFVGTGRGGRKLLNNDASFFRHLPPRRSPGGRGGPTTHGLPIVRRGPRNISPGRCIGKDGSTLLGFRHSEKFMRGFPDNNTDPVFTRPQTPYEGLGGHFVRGNRNFSSVQRRGLPRIRSKSPIRSRARSPGPWSSPRRRSPDGFGGHPELPHRRSPPIYRMERMRSPDHPCFPGDMVVRRHGSPAYLSRPSNDLRDMDSGRDHGHPRSVMPNRSLSGRVLLRNNRRFDVVDPRERTDSDDYFGGPLHSGRFHELGGDGNVEERRRFGDRREHVRPFRPPYNCADGENFHLNAEDGPKPFRFCQEDDPEFHERGNLREFDRRIKNRPGDAPRRTRSIEEQEGNFRHGGQVWHDDGFDDISRVKRKRF